MDPENVNAMVGTVILDMASLDDTSREYCSKMENSITLMLVANLLYNCNAMVQNHLVRPCYQRNVSAKNSIYALCPLTLLMILTLTHLIHY
jgi:hypothetical protein